jgi:hypothetical protein
VNPQVEEVKEEAAITAAEEAEVKAQGERTITTALPQRRTLRSPRRSWKMPSLILAQSQHEQSNMRRIKDSLTKISHEVVGCPKG